jgi:hypothetical protein
MAQEGTLFIPGHGRIGDSADLAYYQEMITIVRHRIKDMKSKGLSPEEVKAAKPTFDYDPVYGRRPGSPDRFLERFSQPAKAFPQLGKGFPGAQRPFPVWENRLLSAKSVH